MLGEVDQEGCAGEDERVVADEQAGEGEEGVEGNVKRAGGSGRGRARRNDEGEVA